MNFFFLFFYLPKSTVLFENRQQSNARAVQKKTHVFFYNALPKSNARAHLKHRKNIEALTIIECCVTDLSSAHTNYLQKGDTILFTKIPSKLQCFRCQPSLNTHIIPLKNVCQL